MASMGDISGSMVDTHQSESESGESTCSHGGVSSNSLPFTGNLAPWAPDSPDVSMKVDPNGMIRRFNGLVGGNGSVRGCRTK